MGHMTYSPKAIAKPAFTSGAMTSATCSNAAMMSGCCAMPTAVNVMS